MDTLKTAVVVALLLAVLYGFYVMLDQGGIVSPIGPATTDPSIPSDPSLPDIGFGTADVDSAEAGAGAHEARSADRAIDGSSASSATAQPIPSEHFADSSAAADTVAFADEPGVAPLTPIPPADRSSAPPLSDRAPDERAIAAESVATPDSGAVQRHLSDDGRDEAGVFETTWQSAFQLMHAGRWTEALGTLSDLYREGDFDEARRSQLHDVLDLLAVKVVYSTEHHLAPPYVVRGRETLMQVAEKHQVPWTLLRRINNVKHPDVLRPQQELKVVPGPFRAEVEMEDDSTGELTLYLGNLYAGRFPLTVGRDPEPLPGQFKVVRMQGGQPYRMNNGETIPAGDTNNPYGDVFIELGNGLSIHGSPASVSAQYANLGCFSLSPVDARDVLGILSVGSTVTVRR